MTKIEMIQMVSPLADAEHIVYIKEEMKERIIDKLRSIPSEDLIIEDNNGLVIRLRTRILYEDIKRNRDKGNQDREQEG